MPDPTDATQRLWQLWQQGQRPDVRQFLADAGDLGTEQIAAVLWTDQRQRWEGGERVPAEVYLQMCPALAADPECALELIYGEYLLREALGEAPTLAVFVQRFPQYAERLRQQIELHSALGTVLTLDSNPSRPCPATAWPAVRGYDILGKLGGGGMGVVYKARDRRLGRLVALKMIGSGPHADPDSLARLRTEALAVARMRHANIVQIYEVGEHDGLPFLALELVGAGNLAQVVAGRPQPARVAAEFIETLGRAVHHAHQQGIVHRDLKPANILLVSGEWSKDSTPHPSPLTTHQPKITDFGIARQLDREAGCTPTEAVLGTPSYMAPEQAAGKSKQAGVAADVYALGAILYELLTGRPPFLGPSPLATLQQVVGQEPVPPRQLQAKTPCDLETICLKCLRKEPERRYASAQALVDDLRRFLDGKPIQARPAGLSERLGKWTRRHPAVAALLVALVSLSVAGFATVTVLWLHTADTLEDAETARATEAAARKKAEDALLAEADGRKKTGDTLYSSKLVLARYQWQRHQFDRARQTLLECDPARRDKQWRYLDRVLHAQVWQREAQAPLSLAFDAAGSRLAIVESGSVRVFDAASGQEVLVRPGPLGPWGQVAFDAATSRLAVFGNWAPRDKSNQFGVAVFDVPRGDKVGGFFAPEHFAVRLSPRGDLLAILTRNPPELSWQDARDGRILHSSSRPPSETFDVPFFCTNGKFFGLMNQFAQTVSLWDVQSKLLLRTISVAWRRDEKALLDGFTISPEGDRLAVSHALGKDELFRSHVTVSDVASGEVKFAVQAHTGRFVALAFCPVGQRLATAGPDRTLVLWDLRTGKDLLTFRFDNPYVRQLVFSPDGRRLAISTLTTVAVWDTSPFME
jgi:serine/threonine protein kinase/WD40 repeat protein